MTISINSNLNEGLDAWEVSLSGELDYSQADELKKVLHDKVDEKSIDLRVDLSKLDYIDSTGLGVFVGVMKKLKSNDKKVYLLNSKDNVRKIFKISGLDKIFIMEV